MIGLTISHYKVTAKLGQGGMGEVYRATDENLGRDVAIKVLPEEVAEDGLRLARFKREAHLLAALNHTNIAGIHGLEEAAGKPFLVLELVEGEDLAERLRRGPIPVDEAIRIAVQISDALEQYVERTLAGSPRPIDFGTDLHAATAAGGRQTGTSCSMASECSLCTGGRPSRRPEPEHATTTGQGGSNSAQCAGGPSS